MWMRRSGFNNRIREPRLGTVRRKGNTPRGFEDSVGERAKVGAWEHKPDLRRTTLPLSLSAPALSRQNLEAQVGIGEPDFVTTASRTTSSPTTSSASLRSMCHPVFAKSVITIPEVHQHYPPTIPELSRQYTSAGTSAGSSSGDEPSVAGLARCEFELLPP